METSVNNKCKAFTSLEQSRKLAKILPPESADMFHFIHEVDTVGFGYKKDAQEFYSKTEFEYIPCWSLSALLKLIPKRILRKDKIHYGQTFIPTFRWEISPEAIYYTDGNNIMDYTSFRYGENNMELIDAVFKMVIWLKENNKL